MKCPKTKFLSPYLDNELEAKGKTSFESHLKGCARCSLKLKEMQAFRDQFAGTKKYKAPYGFSTRVVALATEQKERGLAQLFPLVMKFAEVLVLLAVISIGIGSGRFVVTSITAQTKTKIASSLSLDVFDLAPPDSVGGAYIALTEANHEK